MKLTHTLAAVLLAALPVAVLAQTDTTTTTNGTTTNGTATDSTGTTTGAAADTTAAAADAAVPAPVTDPAEFVTKATSGNLFEIESSKLALERKVGTPVMEFAQQMIDDHGKAGNEMQTAAAAAGVTQPAAMAAPEAAMLTDLKNASDFEAAYVAAQVKGHDSTVALFDSFATNGPDGPLKDFAAKTLPVLKEHQSAIHAIAGL